MQRDPNIIGQSNFFNRFGQFLIRHNQPTEAIIQFENALRLARAASYPDYMLSAARQLEQVYLQKKDFKNAYAYATLIRDLTDSLNEMSKKDQLIILEIDHEARQRELAAERELPERNRRDNIQYLAITIAIVLVFVILMMLGSFKVPEWSIKALGFVSFILLFEFIILVMDHKIFELTKGEPWKIFLIKIFVIALLLPLHEFLEKRLTRYLINHKLIDLSKVSFKGIIRRPATRVKRS